MLQLVYRKDRTNTTETTSPRPRMPPYARNRYNRMVLAVPLVRYAARTSWEGPHRRLPAAARASPTARTT
jgi:hypothetical protein